MIEEAHSPSTINSKVNEATTPAGRFILVYNKTTKVFTLHANIGSDFLSTNNRKSVIQALGFEQSSGCDFFQGMECFWVQLYKIGAQVYRRSGQMDPVEFSERQAEYAHTIFENFINAFPQICNHYIALNQLVPKDYVRIPVITYSFEIDPELLKSKADIPVWVEHEAPPQQTALRDELLQKIGILKNDYVVFSELLYESGDQLEQSVKRFFEFLGMKVEETEKSFPVDLLAQKDDVKLAIEVTGTNGNINNKDRKVGQAVTYYGEKKEDEKIILVANTYRHRPIPERPKESFTPQAEKILRPFGVCLTTGVTLYRFWKAVLEGKKGKDEIIALLRNTNGILEI
jgi:hypothetical protein